MVEDKVLAWRRLFPYWIIDWVVDLFAIRHFVWYGPQPAHSLLSAV